MGVKGFPTLKTVRPTLTIGKPIVVDYNGARTAAGIVEAVKGLIANHVKRIADKDLDGWLAEKNDTAKAILFSDKSTTSALLRVLAVDYYGTLDIAQIRDKDTAAIAAFGITQYPTFVVLPGGTAPAVVYDGELSKPSMSAFLNRYAPLRDTSVPNASKAAKKASSSGAVDKDDDTTTPRSKDASPPPTTPPALFALVGQSDLQEQCLGPETLTCILALRPASSEDIALPAAAVTALASLGELQTKHRARGVALFPFFAVPAENVGASVLREELGLARDGVVLVAVNGRRGWWRRMPAEDGYAVDRVERWVDGIRLGEGAREKLPEGLVGGKGAEEVKAKVEEAVSEAKEEAKEKEEEATETAEVVEGAKEKAEEAEETVEEKVTHEEL
jgi:protein disulfide-isomerase A6